MCLAVAACSKDELPGTHGEFASLTLSVASSQNDVKTRAVSADADEQRINNLYIFIFNPDGSVDCRNYISSLSASSWTGTIGGLTCGTGKSVAAIANTDNTVVDITREMLDGIASRLTFDVWYFGHHHIDENHGEYQACYEGIYPLGETGPLPVVDSER